METLCNDDAAVVAILLHSYEEKCSAVLHVQFSEQLFNLFMLGNRKRVLHEKNLYSNSTRQPIKYRKNKADSNQLG